MSSRAQHVEAPALIQDERVVDVRAELLSGDMKEHVRAVFGRRVREVEPGRWRLASGTREVAVDVEPVGSQSRVRVAIAVRKQSLWRRVAPYVIGVLAVAAWIVAAVATLTDFRGRASDLRVLLWVGSLLSAFVFTPRALRLATSKRVDVSRDVRRRDELLTRLASLEPRARVALNYRVAPAPLAAGEATENELAENELAADLPAGRRLATS